MDMIDAAKLRLFKPSCSVYLKSFSMAKSVNTSPFFFQILAIFFLAITGCTGTTLTPISQQDGLYEVLHEESFFTINTDPLLPQAIEEASQFCASENKSIEILSAEETPESFLIGTRYKAIVQFKCLLQK